MFGGVIFFPWPIESSGWEINATGRLPRPKFAVANTNSFFTPIVDSNNSLKGAEVRRIVTYEKFLDGQPEADPTQHNPIDVYQINRISAAGRINDIEAIQWELRTAPDRPNVRLPKIQAIKGPCQFSYRTFNGTEFVNGSCPYRGTRYFDEDNNALPSEMGDECAQSVEACVLRHGEGVKIPYMGFISVGDVRR